jgi:hypothetical protein
MEDVVTAHASLDDVDELAVLAEDEVGLPGKGPNPDAN